MKKIFTLAALALSALSAMATPPSGDWEAMGTGKYYEDLFTIFNADFKGLAWDVAVEKSATTDGWYRFAPYATGSAVTEAYGGTDDTWVYVDATDPAKVYFEVATIFGKYEFSQVVPECGYKLGDRYATLNNNVISWPRISVRVTNIADMSEAYEMNTCINTNMALVLPGNGDVTDKWHDHGEVEFIDGIVSPMMNGTAPLLSVTLMERNDAPGYYKLVAPWAQYGSTEDFFIDATDPDFVTCPMQDGGTEVPEYGVFALASVGATWVHDQGISKDEFRQRYPEYVITLKDGLITFPANSVVFNFPMLELTKFYQCERPAKAIVALPGHTAVGNVAAEADAGEVSYYDLSGRRVLNPGAGIYIRRCGTTATKVVR